MQSHLISAALDFGTSYSTWACSYRYQFKRDKCLINTKRWNALGNNVSLKAPTCILIDADGETVNSFGYDAIQTYADLVAEKNHHQYYFFQKFKMQLYSQKIDRNLMIKDISGKSLQAKKVFALAIQFLKDDMLDFAKNSLMSSDGNANTLEESDICWVLTVPAIWDDAAKQFMRESAIEAGIADGQLSIALEPEAASIFCRHLPVVNGQSSLSGLAPGHKYMILDAGGGTVDITVHEVAEGGHLKEIHKASGGDWGGERVNQEFEEFLQNLLGPQIMKEFKSNALGDYMDLMNSFEVKKRTSKIDNNQKITIKMPPVLETLPNGKPLKDLVHSSSYYQDGTLAFAKPDKMRIEFGLFRSFFDPSIKVTLTHVAEILDHVDAQGCSSILMVGGFSGSILLQDAIKERFPQVNVVLPMDPELTIIKGAVIFGHDPTIITQRKLKFTYGTNVVHDKTESCSHPPTPVKDIGGDPHCTDIFSVHVRVNDVINLNEELAGKTYFPTNPFANRTEVPIYRSTEANPQLTTEESCSLVGNLKIEITPMLMAMFSENSSDDVGFSVSFLFGGTEIKVKGVDKMTGKSAEVKLDCLDGDDEGVAAAH